VSHRIITFDSVQQIAEHSQNIGSGLHFPVPTKLCVAVDGQVILRVPGRIGEGMVSMPRTL
jgi:hypothetical protein